MLKSSGMFGIDDISRNLITNIAVNHYTLIDTCILPK